MDDEISELRAELAALRQRLAAVEASPTIPPGPAGSGRLSRRGLLAAAVAGGASMVAGAVTTAAPAAAAPAAPPQGTAVQIGVDNQAAGYVTIITSDTGASASPLGIVNPDSNADSIGLYSVLGRASTQALFPNGRAAVIGTTDAGTGVAGVSDDGIGVYACGRVGVLATGVGFGGTGVAASSDGTGGVGVSGGSVPGIGVLGNTASGTAVEGKSVGTGVGVAAVSSNGYGMTARGGLAPLRLVPATTRGKPTSGAHLVGELYVDSVGWLFYCSRSGTPGSWVRLSPPPSP